MSTRVPTEVYLANLLWEAQEALSRYRRVAEACGFPRLALSDLATFDTLDSIGADLPGADLDGVDSPRWARDRMAALIKAGEQPELSPSGAVYEGLWDEVRDALARLGLSPPD